MRRRGYWFSQFVSAVYFLPILGAILAECCLGKYRTILYLSIVYCAGHFVLAFGIQNPEPVWMLGLGGYNRARLRRHQAMRLGECRRPVWRIEQAPPLEGIWLVLLLDQRGLVRVYDLCPILLKNPNWGPHYAFGLPGIAMVIATIFFWAGRKKFVHIPPSGMGFIRQTFSARRPQCAGAARDHLPLRGGLLVALGPEQRRRLDAAGAAHGC